MKTCTKCGLGWPEDGFHWTNRTAGRRNARCKSCMAEYGKAHYRKNREMYIAKAAKWNSKTREDNQSQVMRFLETHPVLIAERATPSSSPLITCPTRSRTWQR